MEVRGEVRGEGCCFLQAMKAIYTTIRDRLRPRRTRQRTKNYRICQNSAMAKMRKTNPRKQLTSGLNSWVFESVHVANIPPANVGTAQRRSPRTDGVHGEVRGRLKSALRASQERRKPGWLLQGGSSQTSLADVSLEEAQAKHPQPEELNQEISNMEETQASDLHLGESMNQIMNMEETQDGEDLGPAEPASWVVAHAHMWQEMTEPDPVSWCNMPIMYSGPGSKYPLPWEWACLDHLLKGWKSSEGEEGGQQEPAIESTNMAREGVQPDELKIHLDEDTSWVVAHAHIWREMAESASISWCNMSIMYCGLAVNMDK